MQVKYPLMLFNNQYYKESLWTKFLKLIGIELGD